MGILDANQESTDTALRVMASRPLEPETPVAKHSAWTTIPRALAASAAEVSGNLIDVAGAYGQVSAAMGQNSNPFLPESPETRKQRLDEYDRLKSEGINWRTDEGQAAYDFGRDMRPDPMTAGSAENVVFALTKGISKAVGAGLLLGPAGGATTFGASEGMTTAEDLAAQGVDQATRTKAGAVVGAVNAVGMVLPVAGKTLAQTAALVAVGGPASFVAQQQAVRSILENADYGKIAQQYDPLDPAGLALSFMLPAGFATWAKFGAIKAAMQPKPKAGKPAAESAPAESVTTLEQMDAAMVHNLTAHADSRPAKETSDLLRAWDEVHQNPIGPADDPLVRLTPGDVADVLVSRGPVSLKDDGISIKVPGYGLVKFIWRHGPESGKAQDQQINASDLAEFPILMRQHEPEITSTTSEETGRVTKQMTWVVDRPDGRRVVYGTTEFLHDGEHHLVTVHVDGELKKALSPKRNEPPSTSGRGTLQASRRDTAQEPFASSSREVDGGLEPNIAHAVSLPDVSLSELRIANARDFDAVMAQIRETKRRIDEAASSGLSISGYLAKTDGVPPEVNNLLLGIEDAGGNQAGIDALLSQYAEAVKSRGAKPFMDVSADVVEAARANPPAEYPRQPIKGDPNIVSMLNRVDSMAESNPDMPVAVRDDGTHARLADELEALRREAREGTDTELGADDAPLLQVAAECALSIGAAA